MNHFSIIIEPRGDIYNVALDDDWEVLSATRFLPAGGTIDYFVATEIPPTHLIQIRRRAFLEQKKPR